MKKNGLKPLLGFILTLFATQFCIATTKYVRPTATGTGNGSSWTNASANLQSMIDASAVGDTVWVAAGTYIPNTYPTGCTTCWLPREYAFMLKSGVKVYGGFAGTETLLTQRNWETNPTILSGDLMNDDVVTGAADSLRFNNIWENTYHVVISIADNNATTLDGFTIKSATADGSNGINLEGVYVGPDNGAGFYAHSTATVLNNMVITMNWAVYSGGGLFNYNSPMTITHSTFSRNYAYNKAGGMYLESASPAISNTLFSGNNGRFQGGGLLTTGSSSLPTMTGNTFMGNRSEKGAGIYNDGCNYTLTNTVFRGNRANSGGGMYNTESNCTIKNTLFTENVAYFAGGGIVNYSGAPTITHTTIQDNRATAYGGGIYNDYSNVTIINSLIQNNNTNASGGGLTNFGGTPKLINSTITGNSSTVNGGSALQNGQQTAVTVKNCIIWGNTGAAPQGVRNDGGSAAITYSLVQDGYAGTGNLNFDPLFVSASNFNLQTCSPAANAGSNGAIPAGTVTDLAGNPRIRQTTVDMGAYESDYMGGVTPALVITGDTTICGASSATFTATPTHGGATPIYQWKKNGINVGTNAPTYTATGFANQDTLVCVLTSNATCLNTSTATSNSLILRLSPNVTPLVAISTATMTITEGTNVTFTATPTYGGSLPVYQWKKNNVNVGTNSLTYSDATLTNGSIVVCVMTSNAACATATLATSNSITMTVNPIIYTWTGSTSTDWAVATNWNPNGVPTSVHDVIIPTTVNPPTLTAAQTVKNMSLTGTNKVFLNQFNLSVTGITGGSNATFVVTNGTGQLKINNISTTTLFPIGWSATVYAPATIANTPARDFGVNVKQDITLVTKKVDLQWNIVPSIATGNSATISLGWSAVSQGLQFNPMSPVELAQYNGSSWLVRLATVTGTNPYTATATGITNFLPFVVANQNVLADETLPTRSFLKIYPTLTNDFLTIETPFTQDFVIVNFLGQPVLIGKTRERLDVSQLPQGTYWFKAGTEQVKFTKGF